MWVCNFTHIETIYIRLHAQNIKTVSSCPHYHTSTRKTANYNILYKIPSLAPHGKKCAGVLKKMKNILSAQTIWQILMDATK